MMDEVIIGVLLVIANICITALNIKLYTEYFKDRSANRRSQN